MKLNALLLLSASAILPVTALAQDNNSTSSSLPVLNFESVSIAAGPSTLGYTVSADYKWSKKFGIRGVLGYAEIDTQVIKQGIQVEGELWGISFTTDFPVTHEVVETQGTVGGAMVMLDYYPGGNWGDEFRVSVGALKPFYKIEGYGVVDGRTTLRNQRRVYVHDLKAEMSIPNISPVLGIGYNYHLKDNLYLSLDSGVVFNVEYDGSFTGTALYPEDQSMIDAELKKDMDFKLSELEPFAVIGYAGLMLSYRF